MDAPKTGFLHKILATSTAKDPLYLDGDDMVVDDDDGASVATAVADLEILFPADTMAGASNNKRKANQIAVQETDFVPGNLDHSALPMIASPGWATTQATKRLQKDLNAVLKVQETTPLHELGWYVDSEFVTNVYQWIVELHSFDKDLPLAADMKSKGLKSIVLELRFGKDYPMSPPFVRVIRPRFLLFTQGGGGHVTAGGALCMELLTNNGWSAVASIESVLLQVRLAMSSTDPRPARLDTGPARDYGVGEAVDAYIRACQTHGWTVPQGFREMAYGGSPDTGAYGA
ncbi:hypothetical protein LTS18_005687 [Coniosporium uncinatum]|uniref:Uncharacterized protein n=1 Tax=Coniosporium uncinatum TaxID=93489 RepID=A0ACC3D4U3_9PEZI|nr:hypothetical protein LTS18_005687 [Coniosporium uncinatum]